MLDGDENHDINHIVKQAIEESHTKMLSSIERVIEAKMAVGSVRENKPNRFLFKRKGNELQFDFNQRVEKSLNFAKDQLSMIETNNKETTYSLKRAHEGIDEAVDLLGHRNKLIKLADMSDSGWAVVNEYEAHQLADDSEDEKRILKAEARASKKIRESRLKRSGRGSDLQQAQRRRRPRLQTSTHHGAKVHDSTRHGIQHHRERNQKSAIPADVQGTGDQNATQTIRGYRARQRCPTKRAAIS
jgi:hypothetical protein